jgi:hypothetical protein
MSRVTREKESRGEWPALAWITYGIRKRCDSQDSPKQGVFRCFGPSRYVQLTYGKIGQDRAQMRLVGAACMGYVLRFGSIMYSALAMLLGLGLGS